MIWRDYDIDRDRPAIQRIWREVGWLKPGKELGQDLFVSVGRAIVADMDGEPECLVVTALGHVRHLSDDLPFCCVHGVTTSHIARQQGLAGRLTAQAVANGVADGGLVAGLGMFEQGYYDKFGFGSGAYSHRVAFDPARLKVKARPRVPRRLSADDFEIVHAARLARRRGHGACSFISPNMTRADMVERDSGFGLGYSDGASGELTHHIWMRAEDVENGPYDVQWMTYQTGEQFLELMALLRGLGDQVKLARVDEPYDIQLQDLIERPFREYIVREQGKFEPGIDAYCWWQMRICDVPGCLAQTHLPDETVRFSAQLTDPITHYLPEDAPWRGVAGEYIVTLGPESSASPGQNPALPVLKASVNAFTRLWLGVRPASGLAVTDDLTGPPELLGALDRALRLPRPTPDWGF
jgi:hypothetical protein